MEVIKKEKDDDITSEGEIVVDIASIGRKIKKCQNTDYGKEILDASSESILEKTLEESPEKDSNFSPDSESKAHSAQDQNHEAEGKLEESEDIQYEILMDESSNSDDGTYECYLCSGDFNSFPMLRMHLLVIHGVKVKSQQLTAFCDKCGKKVRVTAPKDGPVTCNGCKNTCDKCQFIFKTKASFTKHSTNNPYGTLFMCELCDEGFSTRCDLRIHEQTHKGQTLECNICGKGFREKRRLKDHKDTNCGQDPFKCNKCGTGYFTRTQLHSHEKSHEDPSQNVCPTCGRSFKYRQYLKVHMKVHTKEDLLVCDVCDKTFMNRSNFKVHLETHKANRRRDFVCEVCNKTFFSKRDLKSHVGRSHLRTITQVSDESENTFMCKQCGKMCDTEGDLKDHEKTHVDDGPHDCEVCGKSFRYLASLHLHMRVHSQATKFQCDVCSYNCITKHHLAVHKVTHMDKPYECGICHVPFLDAYSLKKHIRTHEDDGSLQDIEPSSLSSKQKTSLEADDSKDKIKECSTTTSVDEMTEGAVVEGLPQSSMDMHYVACEENTQLQMVDGLLVCTTGILVNLDEDQATAEVKEANIGNSVVEGTQYVAFPMPSPKDKSPGQLQHLGDADSNQGVDSEGSVAEQTQILYQCEICLAAFDQRSIFDDHVKLHSETKLHECHICHKTYTRQILLERHVEKHSSEVQLQCSYCDMQFISARRLAAHKKNAHADMSLETNHKCSYCDAVFKSASSCRFHEKQHKEGLLSKGTLYRCDECNRVFHGQGALTFHKKVHSKVRFPCHVCSESFVTETARDKHVSLHHPHKIKSEYNYSCSLCTASYKQESSLRRHLKYHEEEGHIIYKEAPHQTSETPSGSGEGTENLDINEEETTPSIIAESDLSSASTPSAVLINIGKSGNVQSSVVLEDLDPFVTQTFGHEVDPRVEYACKYCGKKSSALSLHHEHEKTHWGKKPYNCSECDLTFAKKGALEKHKRTHPRAPKVRCKVCGLGCRSQTSMTDHLKMVHGINPHVCETCNKEFSSKSNLNLHMKTHQPDRPFVCDICGQGYLCSTHLRNHMRIHTGEKPLKCSYCSRTFRFPGQKRRHERMHIGDRPYVCQVCNMTFLGTYDLRRHMRKHERVTLIDPNKLVRVTVTTPKNITVLESITENISETKT
ncbi:uncharacterized protein LOC143021453 [Oratosquilla oratoria]|uniref:uncharacterized protein LOC143021453 n=1 Tax=Oratosquilla oratoria TaxID=337810 RepID=UPI003F7730E7